LDKQSKGSVPSLRITKGTQQGNTEMIKEEWSDLQLAFIYRGLKHRLDEIDAEDSSQIDEIVAANREELRSYCTRATALLDVDDMGWKAVIAEYANKMLAD
jgi:hypothetical protein